MRNAQERERVVRIVLPITLIRQLDEALQERLGGFETRTEFVREAVDNMLLELKYEPAQPELHPSFERDNNRAGGIEPEVSLRRQIDERDSRETLADLQSAQDKGQSGPHDNYSVAVLSDLAATALATPTLGAVIQDGIAQVADEHLFGLHNRDYPSIWAAHQLAEITREGLVSLSDYLDEVTRRAWSYADVLHSLEQRLDRKLTVMFPRNLRKLQSAEEGFRAFAVGSVTNRSKNSRPSASGPLFAWKVCQLNLNEQLLIGLTKQGYELLDALDGISLNNPHSPEEAERFFAHLREHAPGDWWGFETTLDAVAEKPDRNGLLDHFKAIQPDWSDAVVGTNSQGYIGRSREWGLIEPKQVQGRYLLTDFGRWILKNDG